MDEDLFFQRKIDYSGYIDAKDFYESFWNKFRGLDFTVYEHSHKKVVRGEVTDWFINWQCLRKLSSYVLAKVDVGFEFYNTKEAEVMENGKKVKRLKGFFRIKLKGSLVIDYNDEWSGTRLKRLLREWYDRFIFGRKPVKPQVHAFGDYAQRVRKLEELMILIYNHLRTWYGLPEAIGFQET